MNIQSAIVPDDLIAEVLSFLPFKSLLQLRCVSKSWKTLISDSAFVKLHLNRSSTHTDYRSHHIPCQFYNFEYITVEQLVIVSLDLGTETYNQYKLPCGFDELPPAAPIVGVLGGYLCFSYSCRHTYFVLWQMKKYGAEDSWTQFLKISYLHLQVDYDLAPSFQLLPVLLFEDADTLILSSCQENEAILYNWRDNKVMRTNPTASKPIINNYGTSNQVSWSSTSDYIESLVSIF